MGGIATCNPAGGMDSERIGVRLRGQHLRAAWCWGPERAAGSRAGIRTSCLVGACVGSREMYTDSGFDVARRCEGHRV